MAVAQANKRTEQESQPKVAEEKNPNDMVVGDDVADDTVPRLPPVAPLRTIADKLASIIRDEKLETSAVRRLEELINFARVTEAEEWRSGTDPEAQAKVSTIRYAVRQDLEYMYADLVKHIIGAQETASAVGSTSTEKVPKEVGESAALAKDLASRVGNREGHRDDQQN